MADVFEVIFLIDRSGSMQSIREATVEGINSFISEVQKTPGEGYWTLIQFDDPASAMGSGEEFPKIIYARRPDGEVPKFTLNDFLPRGGTALVDAVCITIDQIKARLVDIDPAKKPKIMFVIVTDGEENSSKKFTSDKMRELTAEAETKLGWKFLYLGANQDAFAVAGGLLPTNNGFNFQGMGGCMVSGAVGAVNNAALPFEAHNKGVALAMASGAYGTRAWKADGNPTALGLLTPVDPSLAVMS